jgi:hypothetical protein
MRYNDILSSGSIQVFQNDGLQVFTMNHKKITIISTHKNTCLLQNLKNMFNLKAAKLLLAIFLASTTISGCKK